MTPEGDDLVDTGPARQIFHHEGPFAAQAAGVVPMTSSEAPT